MMYPDMMIAFTYSEPALAVYFMSLLAAAIGIHYQDAERRGREKP